jgi:DNA-directed RNA polymerase specialized sigma24 family protein
MSDDSQSISAWLDGMKKGDDRAAALLWDRYYLRLVGLARKRMRDFPRPVSDEEDAALSAFHDFCLAVREDPRYADLRGRDNLWRVLVRFTVNKVKSHLDRELAEKRGGGRVQGESALAGPADDPAAPAGLDRQPSSAPDPALLAEFDDKFNHFFGRLNEREAEVAALRLEGHGTDDIARAVGLAPATVRRVLVVVRATLAEVFEVRPE